MASKMRAITASIMTPVLLKNLTEPHKVFLVSDALAEGMDIRDTTEKDQLPVALLNVLLASIAVYGALFAIGYGLYGNRLLSVTLAVTSLCCTALVINLWRGNQPGPD